MSYETSDLEKYFRNNDKRLIFKWTHYFDIYERYFSKYRNTEVVILEIGVFHGGSLQMWKDYFGPKVKIYGIDINPQCKELEEENIEIFIGSQSDKKFLQEVKSKIPKVDILIDDGGHRMQQQIVSFEELFDVVKDDGIYLCEDTHTSYWLEYGGGYKRRGSFIEYSKNFVDYLHAFHSRQQGLQPNSFTKAVKSVHFYDSIVVLEKGKREAPIEEKTGIPSYEHEEEQISSIEQAKRSIFKTINTIFYWLRLPWR